MTVPSSLNTPMIDSEGHPTDSLRALIPNLSAHDVVVNGALQPTPLLRARLMALTVAPLPNVAVPLFNPDGTPTRVMAHVLASVS